MSDFRLPHLWTLALIAVCWMVPILWAEGRRRYRATRQLRARKAARRPRPVAPHPTLQPEGTA